METLPKDPIMLFSVINTYLRDKYDSLDALCDDLAIDKTELTRTLKLAGFEYNAALNKFW
ncbi:MAG: DUF4250 domain-containing protein [Candidatus Limisoma sp.]